MEAGCNISEVDGDGRNCLFHCVLRGHEPRTSKESEALRFLLGIFRDIYAEDKWGLTIFDYVKDIKDERYGSYRRDLWHNSLRRAGLVPHGYAESQAQYTLEYTPQHHRALRYLDSWNEIYDFSIDMASLDAEHPMTEYEAAEMARTELLREQRFAERRSSSCDFSESEDDEFTASEEEADTSELDEEEEYDAVA